MLAPMPRPSEATITIDTSGMARSPRQACRRSPIISPWMVCASDAIQCGTTTCSVSSRPTTIDRTMSAARAYLDTEASSMGGTVASAA